MKEWLLEVGHSAIDVMQSDVLSGGRTRANVCVTFCPAHTRVTLHWLNSFGKQHLCGGKK